MRPKIDLKTYGVYRLGTMAINKLNYRAYVISESDTHYTVVSERDKRLHQIEKVDGVMPANPIFLDPVDRGHCVMVQEPYFTDPSRLFTACREYCYDRIKNAKASVRRVEKKRKARQEKIEEREKRGIMKWGKYKKATYDEILQEDLQYCDWILAKTDEDLLKYKADSREEIVKFKTWLQERIKQ